MTRTLNKRGSIVCVCGRFDETSPTSTTFSEPKRHSHLLLAHHIEQVRQATAHLSASTMDFVKNLAGGNKDGEQQQAQQQGEQKSEGGFMSKLNNMAGGGAAGEKKEDGLDKGEQACPQSSATRRDTDSVVAHRCRLGPRERARPGQAGQRVGSRAS